MEKLSRRIENYWDARSESLSRTRRLELEGVEDFGRGDGRGLFRGESLKARP